MQINLRKAMFVLPNLFTVSSIFLGFYALTLCAGRGHAAPALPGGARHLLRHVLRRVRRPRRAHDEDPVRLRRAARQPRRRHLLRRGAGAARLQVGARAARLPRLLRLLRVRGLRRAPARALQRPRRSAATRARSRFFVGLPIPLAAGTIVSLVIAHYRHFAHGDRRRGARAGGGSWSRCSRSSWCRPSATAPSRTSTSRARSLTIFAFFTMAGVAVGVATRASFVLVVYMAAYIALGLAEAVLARARPAPDKASLPPAIRAELEADEALEPEPEDVEGQAAAGRVHLARDRLTLVRAPFDDPAARPRAAARAPTRAAARPVGAPRGVGAVRLRAGRARHLRHARRDPDLLGALQPLPRPVPRHRSPRSPRSARTRRSAPARTGASPTRRPS